MLALSRGLLLGEAVRGEDNAGSRNVIDAETLHASYPSPVDAGLAPDAARPDLGQPDAAAPDTASMDDGTRDSSTVDGGSAAADVWQGPDAGDAWQGSGAASTTVDAGVDVDVISLSPGGFSCAAQAAAVREKGAVQLLWLRVGLWVLGRRHRRW